MIARREKGRIHGPPAHDQIHKQSQRRLVKKPAAHRKEKLLAPARLAKKHRRNRIHIEERTMIRNEQERSIARRSLDVLEAVNVHDVVSGEMDPARAHGALTPRPESFPGAAIHAPDETECETFKQDRTWSSLNREVFCLRMVNNNSRSRLLRLQLKLFTELNVDARRDRVT